MIDEERNRRTNGHKRVNALFERLRAKSDADPGPMITSIAPADASVPPSRIVLLLTAAHRVDAAVVRQAADLAFPAQAAQIDANGRNSVVRVNDWLLQLTAGTGSYFLPREPTSMRVPELRLRSAISDHKGWLVAEAAAQPPESTVNEALMTAGRLLAAVAPANAMVLYRPLNGSVSLFTPASAALLADGQVFSAFHPADSPVPITSIADDDPRMVSARAEAVRRYDEFLHAFQLRQPGDTFAVKVPFTDDQGMEYMWITVSQATPEQITGRLDNEPAFVRNVQVGDFVSVDRQHLNDWLIFHDNKLKGGFTLKVLDESLRKTHEKRIENREGS